MVKSIETEYRMILLRWGTEMGSHYLTGTEFQFCKIRVLYSGYIMMQMYLIQLYFTFNH